MRESQRYGFWQASHLYGRTIVATEVVIDKERWLNYWWFLPVRFMTDNTWPNN